MRCHRRRRDEDFDQEIRAHLDLEADRLISEGLSPEQARAAARRRFGNVTRVKERFYESLRFVWLDQLRLAVRDACRGFTKTPGFTAAVVATIALGVGGTTAVFSVIYGVLIRPLPYPEPERLVRLWEVHPGQVGCRLSWGQRRTGIGRQNRGARRLIYEILSMAFSGRLDDDAESIEDSEAGPRVSSSRGSCGGDC